MRDFHERIASRVCMLYQRTAAVDMGLGLNTPLGEAIAEEPLGCTELVDPAAKSAREEFSDAWEPPAIDCANSLFHTLPRLIASSLTMNGALARR